MAITPLAMSGVRHWLNTERQRDNDIELRETSLIKWCIFDKTWCSLRYKYLLANRLALHWRYASEY